MSVWLLVAGMVAVSVVVAIAVEWSKSWYASGSWVCRKCLHERRFLLAPHECSEDRWP